MDTQIGLVGYFDILGYQNLLKKNEPEDIAKSVLPFLNNINIKINEDLKEVYKKSPTYKKIPDSVKTLIHKIIDSTKWLVFSDTILLALPFDNTNKTSRDLCWSAFLVACIRVQTDMFNVGLPVRGVINYGKFYIKDTCFAGRTIVDAYQLCNQLELSACVFTNNAKEELDKQGKRFYEDVWAYNYLIPTKNREFYSLVLIAQIFDIDEDNKDNIRKRILSSFWGHNKDIPVSAQKKIANTEQWLCFLKMKREQHKSKP